MFERISNIGTYMRVFIDQAGYLGSRFTLITGGTTTAKTAQSIPFDEDVYIQANEFGQSYEVGWKSLTTGNSSTGKAGHQIKPNISFVNIDLNFWTGFSETISKFGITNYFWNTNIPMFANINKDDVSDMIVYQQSPILKMDTVFINKVINDLQGLTNIFPSGTLRAYVDGNGNLVAADVRETY